MRHHRAREPVRPEEHRLELPPDLVVAEALGGAVDGPPRVVDEHVDGHAVVPALELLDELGGAGRRVDVQREEAAAVGGVGLDLCDEGGGQGGGVARGGDDGVRVGEGEAGEGEAEAGGAARDEEGELGRVPGRHCECVTAVFTGCRVET